MRIKPKNILLGMITLIVLIISCNKNEDNISTIKQISKIYQNDKIKYEFIYENEQLKEVYMNLDSDTEFDYIAELKYNQENQIYEIVTEGLTSNDLVNAIYYLQYNDQNELTDYQREGKLGYGSSELSSKRHITINYTLDGKISELFDTLWNYTTPYTDIVRNIYNEDGNIKEKESITYWENDTTQYCVQNILYDNNKVPVSSIVERLLIREININSNNIIEYEVMNDCDESITETYSYGMIYNESGYPIEKILYLQGDPLVKIRYEYFD